MSQLYNEEIYIVAESEIVMEMSKKTFNTRPSSSYGYELMTATRGLLATNQVILNHGQVTWTTPELAPLLLTTTPHQQEDVSALDRFNVHRCPTRRVFSGTGLELVTRQATIRYLYHSASTACREFEPSTTVGERSTLNLF
ncbi:uncharacterized protein TNCV_4770781 [Trichonephila clavipes]|nr:uncharacterized protein TNCV_4770781 [Trichonephila clavipes]